MIRGKVGNKIPTWCDACGPWNFVTEMALKMNTFEMTRPGNQIAFWSFCDSLPSAHIGLSQYVQEKKKKTEESSRPF